MMSFLPVPAADFVVLSEPLDMSHVRSVHDAECYAT